MLPKHRPPTHAGEMLLKEFLEPMQVTQSHFAKHLNCSYKRLQDLTHGRSRITANSALCLADALGTTPEFWLNLQQQYDLWFELQKHLPVSKFEMRITDNRKPQFQLATLN